ncbi:MAG: esterase/lipase family protein [Acidimicrobiales bacterium]
MPDGADGLPSVVLLHGFTNFDATSELTPLTALADEIAQLGAVVFYFKWHTVSGWSAESGHDMACMGSFVSARAAEFGARSDQVVVVGHSMGASAGASLAFRSFDLATRGDCSETGDQPTVKGFLGVGGEYESLGIPVGADHDSFLFRSSCSAEPRELAASDLYKLDLTAEQAFELGPRSSMDLVPTDLRVVLLVGTLDSNACTLPSVTGDFAEDLQTGGVESEVIELAGADHYDIIQPNTPSGQKTLEIIESILAELEGP